MYHPGEKTEDENREKGGLLPASNDETDGLLRDEGKVRTGKDATRLGPSGWGAKGERVDEVWSLSVQDKTYFTQPSNFITARNNVSLNRPKGYDLTLLPSFVRKKRR